MQSSSFYIVFKWRNEPSLLMLRIGAWKGASMPMIESWADSISLEKNQCLLLCGVNLPEKLWILQWVYQFLFVLKLLWKSKGSSSIQVTVLKLAIKTGCLGGHFESAVPIKKNNYLAIACGVNRGRVIHRGHFDWTDEFWFRNSWMWHWQHFMLHCLLYLYN